MNISMSPVLVINATFEPINICSVKRAMVLLTKGAALVEVEREVRLHKKFMAPSVVRLKRYAEVPRRTQMLSRKNIYIRDGYCCQYCGKKFSAKDLTLDHVVPRSRGGPSKWENLVAACDNHYEDEKFVRGCNHRKGDKTAEEAGMKLLRQPRPLTLHTSRGMIRLAGHEEPSWRKFLYY